MDFEPMYPGFESRESRFLIYFFYFSFLCFFLSLLLQCKFANLTLLSLLSFSCFITPYDAQASSAFSALISVAMGLIIFQLLGSVSQAVQCKFYYSSLRLESVFEY